MIVRDLNLNRIRFDPVETDPPLSVHAKTVLPNPIAGERFQPVAWDRSKIGNDHGCSHLIELSLRRRCNTRV